MSSFNVIYSYDVMELLTSNDKVIDESDKDFQDILKCLSQTYTESPVSDDSLKTTKGEIKNSQILRKENYKSNTSLKCRNPLQGARMRSRRRDTFPIKLHKLLERSGIEGYSSIISWLPHGRAFKIHDDILFETQVMKKYSFKMKYESFKRQLYMYGFKKIGKRFVDCGAYYHQDFVRGELDLCRRMIRWNENEDDFASRTNNITEIPTNLQNLNKSTSLSKCVLKQKTVQGM